MKLTKRIVSLGIAILMLCSGLAVTSSATGETTEGTETTTSTTTTTTTEAAPEIVKHVLNASNCYVDVEKVEIIVKAAKAKVNGTDCAVIFTAVQSDDDSKSLRGLIDPESGDTIFTTPVTGKKYKVTGEVKVGEKDYIAADAFEVEVLKAQNAPSTPVAKKITSTSIELSTVSGCEYRIEGGEWGSKTTFTGLAPATKYTFEMRYAKTKTHYASPASSVTITTRKAAGTEVPEKPVFVDKTDTTITVKEVKGVEFSINNGATWQETGKFTGLKADTAYAIIARFIFDKSEQEPTPACAPIEVKTNSRASYPADMKNCSVTIADGENYANQSIAITVNADTPSKYKDVQYGDTKYVPEFYYVGSSTEPQTFTSQDGRVYKSSFIPGDANAEKKITVTVYFAKMKFVGEADGEEIWVKVGESEKISRNVNVGESYSWFTEVKNFFLGIFDALFNTIPAAINDMLKDFDLSGMLNGLNDLFKALEGVDLGGLTGEKK